MSRQTTKQFSPPSPGIGHNQPPSPAELVEHYLTVSIDEAAAALRIGRDTVYGMVQDGRLIATKFGARTMVHTSSIRQLLATDRLVLPPRARQLARNRAKAGSP